MKLKKLADAKDLISYNYNLNQSIKFTNITLWGFSKDYIRFFDQIIMIKGTAVFLKSYFD